MFSEYPVVTNESLKLKMEMVGENQSAEQMAVSDDGLTGQQALFSQLLTSINPFAQYVIREVIEGEEGKPWTLDENILKRPDG